MQNTKAPRWPTGYKTQVSALCKRAFIQTKKDLWDKPGFIKVKISSFLHSIVFEQVSRMHDMFFQF